MAKRLTTIKKEVENSVKSWIASQESKFGKSKYDSYDYSVRIVEDHVEVCFDGGTIWDYINEHWVSEDYSDSYFCYDTATKIFGLDKYSDWQEYASWRLDIFEG